MTVNFDAVTHVYSVNGRTLPSVTQILADVLGDPTNGFGERWHIERGSEAHKLYALLAAGEDLGLYDYDQRLQGHVNAWRQWAAAEKPEFVFIERPIASLHGYAGTPDAVAHIGGRLTLIDYKQMASKRDLLQLAAYTILCQSQGITVSAIQSLQIDGEGWKYGMRAIGSQLRAAQNDWLAVLRVYQLRNG